MSDVWIQPPDEYERTRNNLHQIAFFALSPARQDAVGRMGLTATESGFGTPEFDGKVARVAGTQIVFENDGNIATQEITTIRAAAEFVGPGYKAVWFEDFHDPLPPADPDASLEIDKGSSLLVGRWFAFGFSVLEQLRTMGSTDDDASEVQMWPEHFDAASELGNSDSGLRASYGASPGDNGSREPYIYVAPWSEIDRSEPYWNAEHFGGSTLGYSELGSSADPMSTALEFFWTGYQKLRG